MQVVKVVKVEEIDSDKLFKTEIAIGGGEMRQVGRSYADAFTISYYTKNACVHSLNC